MGGVSEDRAPLEGHLVTNIDVTNEKIFRPK